MNANDKARFLCGLEYLGRIFDVDVSGKTSGYWEALDDLSIESFEDAAKAASRQCQFFPRPKELRELAFTKKSEPATVDRYVGDPSSEPRYDCRLCLDGGLVTVWHPTIASFFDKHFRDGLPEGRWHDCEVAIDAHRRPIFRAPWQKAAMNLPQETTVVACQCDYGAKYRKHVFPSGEPYHKTYSELNYCLYDGDPAKLRQWVLEWSEANFDNAQWQPEESF